MAPTRGNRPPLTADRRYASGRTASGASKKATSPKAASKSAAKTTAKRSASTTTRRKPQKSGGSGGSGGRRGPIGWLFRLFGFAFRLIWSLTWRSTAIVTLLVAGGVAYFYAELPPVEELVDGRVGGSVTMLDRNDQVFAWRGEQFDAITDPSQVSENLREAVIATEDRRFYRHFGVSPRGVASAVAINLREGRGPLSGHGGSTLTQQTAKLLCLGVPFDPTSGMTEREYEDDCREGSVWRKVKEAIYAMAMEARYTKDEILTIYLNRAYLGASARGFQAAADRYFGVDAKDLTPAQSAMLAGLLVAPTRYAPTNNLERSQARAGTVVRLMYEQGYLSVAERDEAWANPATLSDAAQARAGGYFADWLIDATPDIFDTEDLVIRTTLDQNMQRHAEEALAFIFSEKVRAGSKAEAAIVVMSADGAVRAMVGGRRTKVTGAFNRATHAKRQTGSSFKPFVYAAAMDLGYSPNDTVVDEPYCVYVPGSGNYCPKNYSREFKGRVTLTKALAQSLNIPAVKISELVGRENVQKIATDFGIDNRLANGPALALGVSESTLTEMTGAYAGILNGGRAVKPYGLVELRIQGDSEPLVTQDGGYGERVISEQAARSLVYMMSRVVEEGTGRRARMPDRPAAGKTGTTQAARDAWFIGFTADYVVGVWMGYDDNTPLSDVTGGGLPAEIWHEVMLRIHEGVPVSPLPMDEPRPATVVAQPPAPVQQSPSPSRAQPEARQANREARRQERQERRQRIDEVADGVLRDVLKNLFGPKN